MQKNGIYFANDGSNRTSNKNIYKKTFFEKYERIENRKYRKYRKYNRLIYTEYQ